MRTDYYFKKGMIDSSEIKNTVNYKLEIVLSKNMGNVGIYTFYGELVAEHEDEMKLILIRAVHGMDRAVLDFKQVTKIDLTLRKLINEASNTSAKLKKPLILTGLNDLIDRADISERELE
jgi:anti-anti-sigma regulatory factor